MIAEAMVASGLGPDAFGLEPSPELGGVVFEVMQDQNKAAREQNLLNRLRKHG